MPRLTASRTTRVGQALGLRRVVRDQDHREVEPGERPLHRVARRLVERGRRLVEQQHLGFEGEGASEHHPLLLADREPRGLAVRVLGGQPRERQAAVNVGVAAAEARAVGHVVGDAARKRRRQLGHEAGSAAQLERVEVANVVPGEADLALRRGRRGG